MADDRPRITRVTLRNYRSIESCDVALGDLALLVGPNGSGKSSFLDAITFLREAVASIPDAVRRRGGMRDVSFQGCGEFSIGLTIEGNGRVLRYELEIDTGASGGPSVRTTSLIDEGGARRLIVFSRDRDAGGREHHPEHLFLPESGSSSGSQAWQLAVHLAEWRVFDPDSGILRIPQDPDPVGPLEANGLNAPFYYRGLAEENSSAIESYLRMIVPGLRRVEGVALPPPESLETVRFTVAGRDDADFVLPARAMSDGTLRAFTVLVAMFGASGDSIGIEEPEASLHPAAARVLLEALKEASEQRQIIATTHSPDLLDHESVRAEEILAVRYLRGRSYIGPLDQVGRKALAESLYTAGELLQKDQLLPETPLGEKPLRFDA